VALDPTFAIGYYALSQAADSLLDYQARDAALEKAKTFSAKASERERLFIEARYAQIIEHDQAKRRGFLRQLLDQQADDKAAHFELGQAYLVAGRIPEALAEYGQCVAIDPKFAPAFNMRGYSYAELGDFPKAIQSFESYAALNPGLPNPIDSVAEMNMQMGNLDEAVKKYREALAIKPDFTASYAGLAYVYGLKEDYSATGACVEEFLKREPTPQARMEGAFLRVFYDYFLGRRKKAVAALLPLRDTAERFKFDLGVAASDFLLSFLYTDLGAFDKARRAIGPWGEYQEKDSGPDFAAAASALLQGAVDLGEGRVEVLKGRLAEAAQTLPRLDPERRSYAEFLNALLSAEAALAENGLPAAIDLGQKPTYEVLNSVNVTSIVPYNLPFLKDVLARAYWKSGALDKAVSEYERLTTIDPKSRLRRLIPPLYHYRFGRVLEEKGEKDRAKIEYQKFLEYWAAADPDIVELKDAWARLSALKRP